MVTLVGMCEGVRRTWKEVGGNGVVETTQLFTIGRKRGERRVCYQQELGN